MSPSPSKPSIEYHRTDTRYHHLGPEVDKMDFPEIFVSGSVPET